MDTYTNRIVMAFEGACADCGEEIRMKFRKFIPDPVEVRMFGDTPRYWYEGTCPNGHYVEVTADKNGCVTE